MYLHGGGYTCGSLEYAKGFASTLATECGVRVFCAAYRLAPEHPYPAALEDAMESYEYLLKKGYPARQILLCGESAGGGLIYALCLKLKELGRPLRAGGHLPVDGPYLLRSLLRDQPGCGPLHDP